VQVIDKNNILKEIERMRSIDKHYTRINQIIKADPKARKSSLGSFSGPPNIAGFHKAFEFRRISREHSV
jgi:hypothetical protein